MKKIIISLTVVLSAALMWSCSGSSKAMGETDRLKSEFIEKALHSGVFRIDVSSAYPAGGRSVILNYPYSITVAKDELDSYLPYFGRAYSAPYGWSEGLNFQGTVSDYKVERNRRGNFIVSFEAHSREDFYTYTLTVTPTGSTTINVQPARKQNISFGGDFDFSIAD